MPTDHAEVIGTTEAARRIGVDKSTLTRWVQQGRVKAGRLGPLLTFARTDVDKLAASWRDRKPPAKVEA